MQHPLSCKHTSGNSKPACARLQDLPGHPGQLGKHDSARRVEREAHARRVGLEDGHLSCGKEGQRRSERQARRVGLEDSHWRTRECARAL